MYSSKLYFKGYLRKISGNVAHDRYCFLLDNLLVMTRRLLTNDRFRVTGTMFTQGCTLDPMPDGEYTHNKVNYTHPLTHLHPHPPPYLHTHATAIRAAKCM